MAEARHMAVEGKAVADTTNGKVRSDPEELRNQKGGSPNAGSEMAV